LDLVVNAARLLADEKRIRFIIAGAGPARSQLEALAKGLSNILFLPLQPVERLSELLAAADVHVLPQHKGAADLVLPSKLGGMLASGRLVAATADPGTEIAELLTDIALLSPPGDAAALAQSILAASRLSAAEQSVRIERGMELARTLSSDRLLVEFERALLGMSAAKVETVPVGDGHG
jgi:colanic acid biosynthesis glycosyl transferase WcaI